MHSRETKTMSSGLPKWETALLEYLDTSAKRKHVRWYLFWKIEECARRAGQKERWRRVLRTISKMICFFCACGTVKLNFEDLGSPQVTLKSIFGIIWKIKFFIIFELIYGKEIHKRKWGGKWWKFDFFQNSIQALKWISVLTIFRLDLVEQFSNPRTPPTAIFWLPIGFEVSL